MARPGITRYDVEQARDRLASRGARPSIDAVRIELGNTGSKSTIHRFLQEIAQDEGVQLEDEQFLNDSLKKVVADLARQLRAEGQAIVDVAKAEHEKDAQRLNNELETRDQALTSAKAKIAELTETLAEVRRNHDAARDTLHQAEIRSGELVTKNDALEIRLGERVQHIESLEEKHQHTRDSLEHYRQSVREQREKEQRRHEEQVQQFRMELRQVGQSLASKQDEVTAVSRDNARLAAELCDAQRLVSLEQASSAEVRRSLDTLRIEYATLNAEHGVREDQLTALQAKQAQTESELDTVSTTLADKEGALQRLEAKLNAQQELNAHLMRYTDARQPTASAESKHDSDEAEDPDA